MSCWHEIRADVLAIAFWGCIWLALFGDDALYALRCKWRGWRLRRADAKVGR